MGCCRRSVAELGVGRDGVLHLLCKVLHPECIDLGLVHHIVTEGPVGVRLCSGLSDLNAGGGDGRRRAGAVQAADKALNEILAPLHSLPGQGFYPADRAGDALLHGLCHRRRHAFDAAGQPLQDVCPEIQPVEGGDHRDDGLHDLAHILDDERDAVDKTFAQLRHEADRTGQNLRRIVVDEARDIDDNIGDVGEELRQALHQPVCKAEDEVDACRDKITEIRPQLFGEGEDGGQRLRQKIRDACGKPGCEILQQLRAGLKDGRGQRSDGLRDAADRIDDQREKVVRQIGAGRLHKGLQRGLQVLAQRHLSQNILGCGLHGGKGAGQGGGGLPGRGAGDVQLGLDDMDGAVHVGQIAEIILHAGDLLGVLQQALHLSLRAAVAQLEVVEHGIVLLRKALIGVLDVLHRGTHLVCVVRHIHHRHVGQLRRRVGVLTDAGKQAGREAGCGLHVVVGRKSGGLVGLCGIGLDLVGAVLEQRFDAAEALLESTARVD